MPAGRPVGSKNSKSNDLKQKVIGSFDRVGGIEYLVQQAKENPVAYMALIGKVIPKDIEMTVNRSIVEEMVEDEQGAAEGESKEL